MSEIFRAFENWRAHCVQEGGGLSLDSATHSFLGPKEMVLTDICILPYTVKYSQRKICSLKVASAFDVIFQLQHLQMPLLHFSPAVSYLV